MRFYQLTVVSSGESAAAAASGDRVSNPPEASYQAAGSGNSSESMPVLEESMDVDQDGRENQQMDTSETRAANAEQSSSAV